jgi:hypothetical protein
MSALLVLNRTILVFRTTKAFGWSFFLGRLRSHVGGLSVVYLMLVVIIAGAQQTRTTLYLLYKSSESAAARLIPVIFLRHLQVIQQHVM